MTYSEEKYNALLAVCNSYKNDYDSAFERLKAQQREIERLKAENACLLKACEEQFTFDTTENRTYSIFNSVRKDFAEKVKGKSEMFLVAKGDGVYGEKPYVSIEKIDELLKEYE